MGLNFIEREVEKSVVKNFLAKHWGNIASVLAVVAGYIKWQAVTSWAQAHSHTASGVALLAFLTLYNARSPKDKVQG